MNDLLKITTVYGETCYVSRQDFERCRIQIPLRFKTGLKLSDGVARPRGEAITLHRDNIALVNGVKIGGAA